MDRELPIEVVKRRKRIRIGIGLTVLGAVLLLFSGLRAILGTTLNRSTLLTSLAEIGEIEATVTASGVVVPEFEQILTAPIGTTIEAIHIRSGDSVRAGESILQLDTVALGAAYRNIAGEIEIQKNRQEQVILGLEREQADLQASHDIKILNEKFALSKFERAKRLFDIGGITRTEFDLTALELEIARRELQQLGDQLRTAEASYASAKRQLEYQLSVQSNQLSETRRQISLTEARAIRSGILTWVNDHVGAAVSAGEVIAKVGDLSSFEVEATISDVHIGKLSLGGNVIVRIRDTELRGTIASIRPEIQNGVVSFVAAIGERSHPALHPNLRADVFVVTSTVERVVRVRNGPFYNGTVNQEVFMIVGDRAVKTIVDIGVSNFDWVEIKRGIEPGAEVIVSDTRRFRHLDEVAVR